jgi:hypothetical protein
LGRAKTTVQWEKQRWYGHGTPCPCKGGEHTGNCGLFLRFPYGGRTHTFAPTRSDCSISVFLHLAHWGAAPHKQFLECQRRYERWGWGNARKKFP